MYITEHSNHLSYHAATRYVVDFARFFGRDHLDLAFHAAFPLALTPDLLYQIWKRFVPQAPWTSVSDLLLSKLCNDIGRDLYEINISIRNILLEELERKFGSHRLDELNEFLNEYILENLADVDFSSQELILNQGWSVLAYRKPNEAAEKLVSLLEASFREERVEELVRLSTLASLLSEPLKRADGGIELLAYCNGVAKWISGDLEKAAEQFNTVIKGQRSAFRGQGKFGGNFNIPLKSEEENSEESYLDFEESENYTITDEDENELEDQLDKISVQTKYGQLLDALTSQILSNCDMNFRQDWQYDSPTSSKLDYIFFDDKNNLLGFMEVTQTERNDSFRMKVLRYFNLIAEAKIDLGVEVSSVSLMYGTPSSKLLAANLNSAKSIFDLNLVPREDKDYFGENNESYEKLKRLEERAMQLVRRGLSRGDAIADLLISQRDGILVLEDYFRQNLVNFSTKPLLEELWNLERQRVKNNAKNSFSNKPFETYYKRGILHGLSLDRNEFDELLRALNLDLRAESDDFGFDLELASLSENLKDKLKQRKIITSQENAGGEEITFKKAFRDVLESPRILKMVGNAREELDKNEDIKWYFEDIYSENRRLRMVEIFFGVVKNGQNSLEEAIYQNLISGNYSGIKHSRCWLADLIALQLNKTQNELGNFIENNENYTGTTGKPFRDASMRFERIVSDTTKTRELAHLIAWVWGELSSNEFVNKNLSVLIEEKQYELSEKLLNARLKGTIRLNRFDPLRLIFEKSLDEEGWHYQVKNIPSVLSDLVDNTSLGRFRVYQANKNGKLVILNVLQIIDAHKPQEWAARGRALRYRIQTESNDEKRVVRQLEDAEFVFALDGKVTSKMRRQLERGGWRTCALDDLPEVLADIERRHS